MPLSVNCATPSSGVVICELDKMEFVLGDEVKVPTDGTITRFQLLGGPDSIDLLDEDIYQRRILLDPPAAWLAVWDELSIKFISQRPVLSSTEAITKIEFKIETTYTCTDAADLETEQKVKAYNSDIRTELCYEDTQLKAIGQLSNGLITHFLFSSSLFADCNGVTLEGGNFKMAPQNIQVVDVGASYNDICLDITGGTSPYGVTIIQGRLPSGRQLDQITGCITGEPDGNFGGTEDVIIQVVDSNGDTATVTCRYLYCAYELGDLSNITH